MRDTDQRTSLQNVDPQLFMQFPPQGSQHIFAGFDLAAGKFPPPALMDMERTAGDEDQPLLVDDGCDSHMNSRDQERYSALMRT